MVLLVSRSQSFLACHKVVFLGPLLFILYISEMFELMEDRLHAYAYEFTLLAVVRKPAGRPAVAASLTRDLATIPGGRNHWILIPNTTKTLVVSRSRTVNHVDLVWSGVSICASPNLDILGMKLDSRLTFEDHVRGIVFCVTQIIGILLLVKRVFGDLCVALLLLCIWSPNP